MTIQYSYEAVSAPRHCFDIPGTVGCIVQASSELIYGRVQAMLEIDKGPLLPDSLMQLLVRNHVACMIQQNQQNLNGLAGQTDTDATLQQLPRWNIDFEGPEGQPGREWRLRQHLKYQ